MSRHPKYLPGEMLDTRSAVLAILDGRPLFVRGRLTPAGWAANWNISTLRMLARVIREAVKNPLYIEKVSNERIDGDAG